RPLRSTLFPYTTLFRSRTDRLLRRHRQYQVALADIGLAAELDRLGVRRHRAGDDIQFGAVAGHQLAHQGFQRAPDAAVETPADLDRKSTRLNSSHSQIS